MSREMAAEAEGRMTQVYLTPFRIDVTVRPDVALPVSRRRLATAVRAALEAAGAPSPASLGVVLSDDRELAALPPEAFGRRGSSPAAGPGEGFMLPPGSRAHLGDMIVSVERAIAQANQGRGGQTNDVRWTPAEELLLLAVHGTLHVCGWDHAEPAEEAAMRALEREILAKVGA
jgi:probable rRNA maturation factor